MYAHWSYRFRSLAHTLLIAGVSAGMALAATSSQAQNYPPSDTPPPGSARLAHLEGNVSVQAYGVDGWDQASQNMPIGAGDRVYADERGEGELQAAQVRAYFGPTTDITLTNLNEQGVELGIASGSANIFSDGFPEGQSLFVSTPNGGITLPSRSSFRVDVYPDQQSTVITVRPDGEDVALNGAGGFQMRLHRGESIQLSGTNPVYTQYLEPAPADAFAHWSGAIESHRFNSISARYVSPELPGYDELDSAGDWQPESDYGPIWFPHVDRDWAPYHNGHWVNRPYYGWTWVADEQWGAAPFHYGRWVQMQGRWGWIPGPREVHPVWSPAQVVFTSGIQIGGVGLSVWIPLGPGEAYHPWYHASPEYVNQINQTNIRESKVVHIQNTYVTNNVTNITNVTNVTYVNRTVGATAMKQEDFAAGHNAKAAAVKVDPRQMEHVQVAPPPVKAPAQPIILHPVAKPAAAAPVRPVLINHQGQQQAAAPNAKPVAVPVKATPPVAPKPLPGHTPVGAPAIGAKPAAAPTPAAPAPTPVNPPRPAAAQPLPPARTPVEPAKPAPTPAPVNPPRPAAAQPLPPARTPVEPAKPLTPAPKPAPVTPQRPAQPEAKPTPPPVKQVAPQPRPAAPETRPAPPASQRPAPPAKPAPKKNDTKDGKTPPKKPE